MAQEGRATHAALINIKYELGPTGVPLFTLGDQVDPQPRLTIMRGTEITNGRIVWGEELHGADNISEQQALIQAWVVITEAVQGRLNIR